jgi:hypothetical protein
MGLRAWLAAQSDGPAFNTAMNGGNFALALEIAARGHIDESRCRLAEARSKLAASFQNFPSQLFSPKIRELKSKAIELLPGNAKPLEIWQVLLCRAEVRRLLELGNFDDAAKIAARIPDNEIRAQAFRCAAANAANNNNLDDAVSFIAKMGDYQSEETKNLFLSLIIRQNFQAARGLTKGLPQGQNFAAYKLEQFAKGSLFGVLGGEPEKLEWSGLVDFVEGALVQPTSTASALRKLHIEPQIANSLLYCTKGQIKDAAQALTTLPSELYSGILSTIAISLAYAGKKCDALDFLSHCPGSSSWLIRSHLFAHFLYDSAPIVALVKSIDQQTSPQEIGSLARLILMHIIDAIGMEKFALVDELITSVRDQNLRLMTVKELVYLAEAMEV